MDLLSLAAFSMASEIVDIHDRAELNFLAFSRLYLMCQIFIFLVMAHFNRCILPKVRFQSLKLLMIVSCELGLKETTEPTGGTQLREYWGGPTNGQSVFSLRLSW